MSDSWGNIYNRLVDDVIRRVIRLKEVEKI